MIRPALAFTALALAAMPAAAATYSAKPMVPTAGRFIARDIVWRCGPEACLGATESGRPLTVCQSLAKRTGPIASFIVDGRALAVAELDRCNAAAKAARAPALAAQ
ncbi:MAG: hypothetical protein ABIS38_06535 [Sphingomicrobium sp.]